MRTLRTQPWIVIEEERGEEDGEVEEEEEEMIDGSEEIR